MDLTYVFKGSLLKVIAELKPIVPKEQFDTIVKKYIPNGLDGIENIKYDPVKRDSKGESEPKSKKARIFDISKYRRRHIALRVFYDGSSMGGFAQHDSAQLIKGVASDNSIESALFAALKKVNLIDDITKCHYQRCGRTDIGVSAFNQVISLYLRSNLKTGVEFVDEYDDSIVYNAPKETDEKKNAKEAVELDYPAILNRVLPANIRVTGWASVDRDFSARFSCCGRVYRYYFLRRQMDIDILRQAVKLLEGEHDFRNFCRIDTINVCDFKRSIFKGDIIEIKKGIDKDHDVFAIEIIGRAFLWHQIRCIMSILFLVGSKKESLDVIPKLLDVNESPYKPQYLMADPEPLVLYDCIFNPGDQCGQTQMKHYYDIIQSNPLFKLINFNNPNGEKSKYNTCVCNFDNSLTDHALKDLMFDMEHSLYTQNIALARYEQIAESLAIEFKDRIPSLPKKISDFSELNGRSYRPLDKRTKSLSYEERIRNLGPGSLAKLQHRYSNVDLDNNEFIPDVIKETLAKK